jgi:hypothetical protein
MMHDLSPDQAPGTLPDTPAETPVTPYRPASVNSGQAPLQQSTNEWAAMSEELLEDDQRE